MVDRLMELIAYDLDLDPVTVRRRNLIPADRFPYQTPTGRTYDSGNYTGALDLALKSADYDGLRAEHTTAHLLRACIEGVAEALAAMARDVASDVEGPTYWATGGAFCGQLWRDALVRALGHEVNFSDDAEGTARGAAMMAAISLGIAEDIADAATKLGAPTSLLHAQNPA